MTRGLGGQSPVHISHHLMGVDFPATQQDLMQQARENDAPPEVLEVIQNMPDGDFENMADVMKAYGVADRQRGGRAA